MGAFPPGIDDVLDYVTSRHSAWLSATQGASTVFPRGRAGKREIRGAVFAGRQARHLPAATFAGAARAAARFPWRLAGQRPSSRQRPGRSPCQRRLNPEAGRAGRREFPWFPLPRHCHALDRTVQGKPTSLFVNVNRGICSIEERGGLRAISNWAAGAAGPATCGGRGRVARVAVRLGGRTGQHHSPEPGEAALRSIHRFAENRGRPGRNGLPPRHLPWICSPCLNRSRGQGTRSRISHVAARYHTGPDPWQAGRPRRDRDSTVGRRLAASTPTTPTGRAGRLQGHGVGALCSAHALCPFAQNASWLRNLPCGCLLDTLRGAEIAADRRLTHRDLLGHVSLAVVGPPRRTG